MFKSPFTLDLDCVGHGSGFNDHRVIIRDSTGAEFLSTGEYITELFDDCPPPPHTPSFRAPEPPPYGEKSRFILRALNRYAQ